MTNGISSSGVFGYQRNVSATVHENSPADNQNDPFSERAFSKADARVWLQGRLPLQILKPINTVASQTNVDERGLSVSNHSAETEKNSAFEYSKFSTVLFNVLLEMGEGYSLANELNQQMAAAFSRSECGVTALGAGSEKLHFLDHKDNAGVNDKMSFIDYDKFGFCLAVFTEACEIFGIESIDQIAMIREIARKYFAAGDAGAAYFALKNILAVYSLDGDQIVDIYKHMADIKQVKGSDGFNRELIELLENPYLSKKNRSEIYQLMANYQSGRHVF